MAGRGPYSKTARTREQILAAALEIISGTGYSGATLQQIADAVGMSKPGVLHHFGSREGLFTAVLAKRDEIDSGALAGDDDRIEVFMDTARRNTGVPGLVALFTALTGVAASDPPATESRRFFSERHTWIIGFLTEAIGERQQRGEVATSADPRSLARLLVAASDGLQTQWLLDPGVDLVAELELLWSLIAGGTAER